MSTLKVGTIQNVSGASASTPEEISNGRAKAWATFTAVSGCTLVDDFNCSSMTDHGTGLFQVNFSNSLNNATYCLVGASTSYDSDTTAATIAVDARSTGGQTITLKTTSACRLTCTGGSTPFDPANGYLACFVS